MEQNREGRRVARLFRRAMNIGDERLIDLDTIAAAHDLQIVETDSRDVGFTACLLRNPTGGEGGLIAVERGTDAGRRRFSIAHELGHYHIPSQKLAGFVGACADADLRANNSATRRMEWEANDFAAELLMPERIFGRDVELRAPTFGSVQVLAATSMYGVSVTAAAWRLVQTTKCSCALVVSTGGTIDWVARSANFNFPMSLRGVKVHPDSVAGSVNRGERLGSEDCHAVSIDCWLNPHWPIQATLYESVHRIAKLDQVLSLIWLDDEVNDD